MKLVVLMWLMSSSLQVLSINEIKWFPTQKRSWFRIVQLITFVVHQTSVNNPMNMFSVTVFGGCPVM
jgi:hypothetical protein